MVVDVLGKQIDPELVRIIDKEGDFDEWIDEDTGYLCRIRRTRPYACWCGYVRVPEGHNSYGQSYDDVDVNVHGGLTFGIKDFADGEIIKGFWWFGFDCGHTGDLMPYLWTDGVYRTKEYVKNECKELARQLKDMEGC